MKVLKRATVITFTTCVLFFVAVASYNTAQLNSIKFNENVFDIKLAKKLDEMNGEVVFGRVAASLPNLKKKSTLIIKKQVANVIAAVNNPEAEQVTPPAPVETNDLELTLSGGLFNKKPLDGNSEFSGSAKVIDGIVEEVSVSLPDGEGFVINTNERMVGNVFQYEDTVTREVKSGLFYKVKPGVFMITLTNDSQYPGLRLEFKTDEQVEVANNNSRVDQNWKLNNQNDEYSENNNQTEDMAALEEQYQETTESAPDGEYYQDQAARTQEDESDEQQTNFGFNFSS